jgi:FtsH-binding integral membrane protein
MQNLQNLKERKNDRLFSGLSDTLSPRQYNLAIGACIVYGFVINAIIVATCSDLFINMNPWVFLIGYFALAISGIIITTKSNNPVISFAGYNLVVVPLGALLSVVLPGHSVGQILHAAVITAIIFVIMTCLAAIFPQTFAKLGRGLFISLIVLIITELLAWIVFGFIGTIFSWASAIIFTLYIGYDWHVAQSYPKTLDNAIDSACDLYIDLVNLLMDVLNIIDR